jgi:hypothetical protein
VESDRVPTGLVQLTTSGQFCGDSHETSFFPMALMTPRWKTRLVGADVAGSRWLVGLADEANPCVWLADEANPCAWLVGLADEAHVTARIAMIKFISIYIL